MRLHGFAMDGVAALDAYRHGPVTVDADALGDGLIAIVGANGSGKTHLLESPLVALFRKWPSYRNASFISHVKPVDGWVTVDFTHDGHRYGLKVQADPRVNGGKGKTEAYLVQDGVPIAGPNLKAVDSAIAALGLPSYELMLSSVFKAQEGVKSKSASLFALDPSDRRALVAEILRLDYLQTLAEQADAEHKRVLDELVAVGRRAQDAQGRVEQAALADADLVRLTAELEDAQVWLDEAIAKRDCLRYALEEATASLAAAKAQLATRQQLTERLDPMRREIDSLIERAERRAPLLALADNIAAAVEKLPAAEAVCQSDGEAHEALRAEDEQAKRTIATLVERRDGLRRQAKTAHAFVEQAEKAAARLAEVFVPDAAPVELGLVALADEREMYGDALVSLEAAATREREQEAQRARLLQESDLLRPRVGLLNQTPGLPECTTVCPLTVDVRAARDRFVAIDAELLALPRSTAATDEYEMARVRVALLTAIERVWQPVLAEIRKLEAMTATDRVLAGEREERQAAFESIVVDGKAVTQNIEALEGNAPARTKRLGDAAEQRTRQMAWCAQLQGLANRKAELAAAVADEAADAARQDVLEVEFAKALQEAAALPEVDLAALVETKAAAETADVEARREVTAAEQAYRIVSDDHVRRTAQREMLGADPAAELATLRVTVDALTTDATDWALLAYGLGREGVQALEMAAAGPGITALANDLLQDAYGGRFSLNLITTEPKKDGKGDKEVFDLRILDAVTGGPLDQGCGGQMAFLDEAVRLAGALYNAEKSGNVIEEIWRDEPSASFDPEAARAYIAMLRKACERGKFRRCWFISHHQSVWSQADRVIYVHDGRLSIDVPPEGVTFDAAASEAA